MDDTAGYYWNAGWVASEAKFRGARELVYSPAYVGFLGLVRAFFSEPYTALVLQRCLTALLAGFAVLLCARRVLPSPWSWLAAAWWFAVPENSRPLFDIHLFSFIPFAFGCWLAGTKGDLVARGWSLALFVFSAIALRNELAPAAVLFFLAVAIYEWRRGAPGSRTLRHWLPLIAPSLFVVLFGMFVAGTRLDSGSWRDLSGEFQRRQRANLPQVFAFGYQQRHPEWKANPWTDNDGLMENVFGKPRPSVAEAWRANPSALLEHTLWNFRLVPSGLQLALLGDFSGHLSPAFEWPKPAPGSTALLIASAALAMVWLSGLAFLRRPTWAWLDEPRRWTWLALACALPSTFAAIATQRPRPCYVYSTTLLVVLGTVWLVAAWVRRGRHGSPLPQPITVAAICGVLALAFIFSPKPKGTRLILEDLGHLTPHRWILRTRSNVFCSNRPWAQDLVFYLSQPGKAIARDISLEKITSAVDRGTPVAAALEQEGVTSLYLTGETLKDQRIAPLTAGALPGWQILGLSRERKRPWLVIAKSP